MKRFAKPDALEFIETWINLDAADAYQGSGRYEVTLIGVDAEQVEGDLWSFCAERGLDTQDVTVSIDQLDEPRTDCVTISIQTGAP